MERARSRPMSGRIVLVTGGTGGIGKATAIGLVTMGTHVAITGRDPVRAEAVAREIRAADGDQWKCSPRICPPRRRCGAWQERRCSAYPGSMCWSTTPEGTGALVISPRTGSSAPRPQPSHAVLAHQPVPDPAGAQRPSLVITVSSNAHRTGRRDGPAGHPDLASSRPPRQPRPRVGRSARSHLEAVQAWARRNPPRLSACHQAALNNPGS
jgi:hypothetical protein